MKKLFRGLAVSAIFGTIIFGFNFDKVEAAEVEENLTASISEEINFDSKAIRVEFWPDRPGHRHRSPPKPPPPPPKRTHPPGHRPPPQRYNPPPRNHPPGSPPHRPGPHRPPRW